MSNPLTPSFRYPSKLPAEAAHPLVRKAIDNNTNGLVDVNQAIVSLHQTISALKVAATTTTIINNTTSGGSSTSFPGLGKVNDQTGATSYAVQTTDNGILLILNDASPVAISLNSSVAAPFFFFISNFGAGVATLTPTSGTINGAGSITLALNYLSVVVFDGTNWSASAALLPTTIAPVAGEYLTGYNATTGLFSQSSPAGISATITTAALTTLGTQGSMTFSGGILTAQTPAT